MKKKKRNKKNKKSKKKNSGRYVKLVIALGLAAAITGIKIWSVWYGEKNPETGLQRIATMTKQNQMPNISGDVMFLGDSITAREDWDVLFGVKNIINAGISGNTTDDVIQRLDPLLNLKPRKIFLMIGINDLLRWKDVAYVLANYGIILNKIKSASPETQVYIQSVLPVNNDVIQYGTVDSQKIIDLNEGIKALAEKQGYVFVNLYPSFCGKDNKLYQKYAADGLHPDAAGYAVWKKIIAQDVK